MDENQEDQEKLKQQLKEEKKADIYKIGESKEEKTEEELEEEGIEFVIKHKQCKMMVRENLSTGEVEMRYPPKCPRGFVERIAGKIAMQGIRFLPETPKKKAEPSK